MHDAPLQPCDLQVVFTVNSLKFLLIQQCLSSGFPQALIPFPYSKCLRNSYLVVYIKKQAEERPTSFALLLHQAQRAHGHKYIF